MTELRFPKTDEEKIENQAIQMARETLGNKARCWRCQKPVGRENLTLKWVKRLNQQRSLCEECVPLKDEPLDGEDDVTSVKLRRPYVRKAIEHTASISAEIAKFPPPVKECLNCDSNLFYVLRGGIIKCSGCGMEFNVRMNMK